MKSQEKAEELFNKFWNDDIQGCLSFRDAIKDAKLGALICVEEILESHLMSVTCENIVIEYWKEVKQEINQL